MRKKVARTDFFVTKNWWDILNMPIGFIHQSLTVVNQLMQSAYVSDVYPQLLTQAEHKLWEEYWTGDCALNEEGTGVLLHYWIEDFPEGAETRMACPVCLGEVSSLEDGIRWVCNGDDGRRIADWTGLESGCVQVIEWEE